MGDIYPLRSVNGYPYRLECCLIYTADGDENVRSRSFLYNIFYKLDRRTEILTQTIPATQPSEHKTACGGKLEDPTNYPSAVYHGERIYFCTQACLDLFLLNPDPFMLGEVEHPI